MKRNVIIGETAPVRGSSWMMRPADCGTFRCWNEVRCADARDAPPWLVFQRQSSQSLSFGSEQSAPDESFRPHILAALPLIFTASIGIHAAMTPAKTRVINSIDWLQNSRPLRNMQIINSFRLREDIEQTRQLGDAL